MTVTIGSGVSIGAGWGIGDVDPAPVYTNLVLALDASSYTGTGNWIDQIGGKNFVLNNNPTFSTTIGGGSFDFSPASAQWASCSTSLSNMSTWTVEAWHYYTGTNTGVDSGGLGACIVTETYTGTPNAINYSLGNDQPAVGQPLELQSGFFNGAWRTTPTGYSLTPNNWYQVVGTYDGATIKLYVNNTMVQSTSYSGTPTSSGHGIRLMRRWDNADYWGGRLSIVRIYDADIGASGVTQNWQADKDRFGL